MFWGCSIKEPVGNPMGSIGTDRTIVDGDYEYNYLPNEGSDSNLGFESPHTLTPQQSGYIITRYTGEEVTLELPTIASDGTPIIGIGRGAFSLAPNLKELSVPAGYQYIFDCAFLGLSTLESVYISSTVEYIAGGRVFELCNQLRTIQVAADNPIYMSDGNCLIEKSNMEVIAGCAGSVLPQGVLSIGSCAFSERTGPTEVFIPDSVLSIKSCAFMLCDTSAVHIAGQPQNVGEHAFTGCEKTIIYCNMAQQPTSWHLDWLGESCERYVPPTVIWIEE